MAIKKATFLNQSLPLATSNRKYFIRYRIVSDDGSLTSQWSSIYELEGNSVQEFVGYEVITNVIADGTLVTYTANNSFVAEDNVVVSGVIPENFNFNKATVYSATPTTFTVESAETGTYGSGGIVSLASKLSATVSGDEEYVFLQWEPVGSLIITTATFDVFAQWSEESTMPAWTNANYEYVATVSANNFSVQIPANKTYGSFLVQIATHDRIVPDTVVNLLSVGEISSDLIYDAPPIDGGEI